MKKEATPLLPSPLIHTASSLYMLCFLRVLSVSTSLWTLMLTPSRTFYTAISVGELGVLFSLSVYVVSFVLRWFFYGVFSSFW